MQPVRVNDTVIIAINSFLNIFLIWRVCLYAVFLFDLEDGSYKTERNGVVIHVATYMVYVALVQVGNV